MKFLIWGCAMSLYSFNPLSFRPFIFWDRVSRCNVTSSPRTSSYRTCWPWTYTDLPISASGMLGLKAFTTTNWLHFLFFLFTVLWLKLIFQFHSSALMPSPSLQILSVNHIKDTVDSIALQCWAGLPPFCLHSAGCPESNSVLEICL